VRPITAAFFIAALSACSIQPNVPLYKQYLAVEGLQAFNQNDALPPGVIAAHDGYVTAYILPYGERRAALIDCGNHTDAHVLLDTLHANGLDPTSVTTIFLTHGHPDHTAGCQMFPQAKVLAMPDEVLIAEGATTSKALGARIVRANPAKATKVGRSLRDGEEVKLDNLTVRVFWAPGHTAGSAVYYARHTLFLGDSAWTTTNGGLRGGPRLFTDDASENLRSMHRVWEKLGADRDAVKVLAPGHTGVLQGTRAFELFLAGK
jgi:glyoxylase-like metal-dependent hydrolase (beta-lactamase superfamily II)